MSYDCIVVKRFSCCYEVSLNSFRCLMRVYKRNNKEMTADWMHVKRAVVLFLIRWGLWRRQRIYNRDLTGRERAWGRGGGVCVCQNNNDSLLWHYTRADVNSSNCSNNNNNLLMHISTLFNTINKINALEFRFKINTSSHDTICDVYDMYESCLPVLEVMSWSTRGLRVTMPEPRGRKSLKASN